MGTEILTFGNIEIEKKNKLPPYNSYFFERRDIEKELVSNKIYFIGYFYKSNNLI